MAIDQKDSPKIKLKLLIDKKAHRVLLAEAGKDAVDFLFSLLTMPVVGSVIKLITKESMVGSLGCTYGRLEQLDTGYFLLNQNKNNILQCSTGQKYCPNCRHAVPSSYAFFGLVTCQNCLNYMKNSGYVIGTIVYSIMDDLSVVPMTPTSTISLLDQLGINDFNVLKERTVTMQYQEGLELLKTSLWSKNVLTEVFLAKNKKVGKKRSI